MKRPRTEPPPSLRQLAKDTGIARAVLWRAKQVANIPEAEFEALVESDKPPTVTRLVEIGRARSGTQSTKRASGKVRALKRAWAAATPEERKAFADWTAKD